MVIDTGIISRNSKFKKKAKMKIKQKTWVLEKPLKFHWIRKITTREARTNDVNKVRGFLY